MEKIYDVYMKIAKIPEEDNYLRKCMHCERTYPSLTSGIFCSDECEQAHEQAEIDYQNELVKMSAAHRKGAWDAEDELL